MVTTLDEVCDRLYGADPDLFIGARTAAVAQARADGDKALAKQIGALRKPTRSAWLVNLLARRHPDRVAALPDLAARLAAATAAVDLAAMRETGAERTSLVADLTRLAVTTGQAEGYDGGEAVRAEVSGTLQAALADPDVLAAVLAGRLDKAQVYAGFGFAMAPYVPQPAAVVPDPAAAPVAAPEPVAETEPAPVAPELAAPVVAAPDPAAEPVPAVSPERAAAQAKVDRWTELYEEAVATRVEAEAADEAARAALDRASQEVADLRAELRAAEADELRARDTANATEVELHDARTAEQQAKAALDRAIRARDQQT